MGFLSRLRGKKAEPETIEIDSLGGYEITEAVSVDTSKGDARRRALNAKRKARARRRMRKLTRLKMRGKTTRVKERTVRRRAAILRGGSGPEGHNRVSGYILSEITWAWVLLAMLYLFFAVMSPAAAEAQPLYSWTSGNGVVWYADDPKRAGSAYTPELIGNFEDIDANVTPVTKPAIGSTEKRNSERLAYLRSREEARLPKEVSDGDDKACITVEGSTRRWGNRGVSFCVPPGSETRILPSEGHRRKVARRGGRRDVSRPLP